MLYHPEALFELVKPLGKPLRVDSATAAFTRLEKARILVEIGVTKPIPEAIVISVQGQKMKLPIKVENVPFYCTHCSKVGHKLES